MKTTGHERTHFTVVLACIANGFKVKPMVIFKRKRIPKGEKIPAGVLVHCHPKGWMDEDGILLWLEKVWNNRPGALMQKKALLVWDQFCAHKTEKVKDAPKRKNTFQAMIPGGLTSVLQPLDVVLNKPFKDRLRQKWLAWMSLEDDKPVTKGGNIKKPSTSLVLSWVKSAWEDIPEEMVEKSFLKTGIANPLDGSADDEIWNDRSDEESDEVEETLPPSWDADEDVPEKDWDRLFEDSDSNDDFDGF